MSQRISRKELKQDEFVDAAVDVGHWMEKNWPTVVKWAAGLAIVVLVAIGWIAFARNSRIQAENRLAGTLRDFEKLQFDGFVDTATLERVASDLDDLAGAAGSSPAGKTARFYRGAALYQLGRYDEAATVLEDVVATSAGEATLNATAYATLANSYQSAGRADDAIALLEPLLDSPDSPLPADQVLLRLGRIYSDAGRTDEARRLWQRIVDEFPTGSAANQARQLIGA